MIKTVYLRNAPADDAALKSATGGDVVTVVHAVPGAWLEQTQTWLYEQTRALRDHTDSHVACPKTMNLEQFWLPNIHTDVSRPMIRRLAEHMARQLRLRRTSSLAGAVARQFDASILHSHFGYTAWRQIPAARRMGLKHVVTFYGLDVNHLPRHGWMKRYRAMFGHIDLVLCEGPHMARCIVGLGCDERKVHVHHLGVNLEKIPFRPLEWTSAIPLRCLIAASFREKKGIPFALEALGRIAADTPLDVTVIGDAAPSKASQAERKRIIETIQRCNLGSRVRMLGFQPHDVVLREAERHHLFLQPSVTAASGDTEGGAPICLIEMMASGLICIATHHCDIPEVVNHGRTGWLAPERDVDALADCLRRAIDRRKEWPAIRQAGREHVQREFDSKVQAERLADIYRSLARA
jgi:colanic acid/amylovoran biosynthesis glycosyltransferase